MKKKTKPMEKKTAHNNLDSIHSWKISQIESKKKDIGKDQEILQGLENELTALSQKPLCEQTIQESIDIFRLETKIKSLREEIHQYDSNDVLLKYYMKNGVLLYKYYTREKDDASHCQESSNKTNYFEHFTNTNDFTNIGEGPIERDGLQFLLHNERNIKISKQALFQEYLFQNNSRELFEESSGSNQPHDHLDDIIWCIGCNSEKQVFHNEALAICKHCGDSTSLLVESNRVSNKDIPREVNFYSYKRINHFNEWLAQFQAKESTDIPEDVYNKIYVELKKERITNMATLTSSKVKEILKRLKFNKYYEHIPHIINRLNSIPAPIMSRETEEKLRSMFKQIQAPFMKFCPEDRNNFLSYSYVLHKFCQLLNLDEFLVCFPLLKSREKLYKHDIIWEQICTYLNWEFIKSI
jgi:hypothetical protein